MVTLAGVQGGSLVPDFSSALNVVSRTFDERQKAEQAARQRAEIGGLVQTVATGTGPKQQSALLRLSQLNPAVAKSVREILDRGDEQEKAELAQVVATRAKNATLISRQPDFASKQRAINSLAVEAQAEGRSIDRFVELSNMDEDQLDLALQKAQITATDLQTLLKPTGVGGRFTKGTGVISRTEEGGVTLQIPVLNQDTGNVTLESIDVPGDVVSRLGETGTEQSLRLAGQAGLAELNKRLSQLETAGPIKTAEKRALAIEARSQGIINRGLDAADTVPILNRSIALLDSVKTGGFDRAALSAKQFFGIESANEAELSANLGKTVLSQLRTTFGAAFTEREGARLAAIEAGFGKSVAGNRRLLQQTKRIAERAANRAIKVAEKAGDIDTADEIRAALEFTLDSEPVTDQVQSQEGATATNPTTGEQLIFRDGRWQTL